MAGKIFINYRRDDSISTAGRLHDRLAQTFGRKSLFMDVDHIPAGVDFVDYLASQVAACDVFLSVIGPNWLDAKDDDGRRRFDNPDDFVTIEIAAALARNIRVIPVLVDGARTPKADKLPDSVKPLARRNAVEVRNTNFGRDAEALVDKVREALESPRPGTRQSAAARLMALVAGGATALLLVGWIGLYHMGVPVWVPWTHPDGSEAKQAEAAALKAKEDRERVEATAKAEADAKRKAEEEPMRAEATAKAEADAKRNAEEERMRAEATAKAEADAKRKAEEERMRAEATAKAEADAKRKAEEDRMRAEATAKAEADAKRKAEEDRMRAETAARPDPALAVQPGSGQSFRDRLVDGQPCPTCPEMVVVPAGGVMMGSPENERGRSDAEGPQQRVAIASPLAIGKFSITRGEFAAFVMERTEGGCDVWTGSEWRRQPDRSWRSPSFEGDRHPVVCVNWYDAKAFVAWLSRKVGKVYRLLTEAEREYAARAKTATRYSFGDDEAALSGYAWYQANSGGATHPVGEKKPNAFGLFDMHGNAWAWCEDIWHSSYRGAPNDGSAWLTGDTSYRVLRGGSWYRNANGLRSAFRIYFSPDGRYNDTGFRVARGL
jgi:formylglycine-generating enzyme required for sulfatase activity